MSIRTNTIHRIIITISVNIQPGEMFGIKVRKIILGDKSSRFRIVVSALQIVQTRFRVVIVASVSNRVDRCDTADIRDNLMIAPFQLQKNQQP